MGWLKDLWTSCHSHDLHSNTRTGMRTHTNDRPHAHARAHTRMHIHTLRMQTCSTLPFSSTIAGCTPKKGSVAEPGLCTMALGNGVIMCAPVSVCHQVSIIGHLHTHTCVGDVVCDIACA